MRSHIGILAACLGLGACSLSDLVGTGCKTVAIPSFQVTVRDSTTGALIARGTTVIWRGPVTDSTTVPDAPSGLDSLSVLGPLETRGRFDVSVHKAGYKTWTRTIQVSADDCHVKTVALTARLQPATAPDASRTQGLNTGSSRSSSPSPPIS